MTINLNTNQPKQQVEDERYLSERLTKGNPYVVPEGYFDKMSERVMQRIDESERVSIQKRRLAKMRLWSAAAAVALLVGVSATLFFHHEAAADTHGQSVQAALADTEGDYFDQAADYLATDNNDIYAYLAYE
jgi:hypothetical protein